jgi:hypothetical protein
MVQVRPPFRLWLGPLTSMGLARGGGCRSLLLAGSISCSSQRRWAENKDLPLFSEGTRTLHKQPCPLAEALRQVWLFDQSLGQRSIRVWVPGAGLSKRVYFRKRSLNGVETELKQSFGGGGTLGGGGKTEFKQSLGQGAQGVKRSLNRVWVRGTGGENPRNCRKQSLNGV